MGSRLARLDRRSSATSAGSEQDAAQNDGAPEQLRGGGPFGQDGSAEQYGDQRLERGSKKGSVRCSGDAASVS